MLRASVVQKPKRSFNPQTIPGEESIIGTFLPPDLFLYLQSAIHRQKLVPAGGWLQLEKLARSPRCRAIIFDPAVEEADNLSAAFEILKNHPRLPVICYTRLTPHSMRAVAPLSRRGLSAALLHPPDGRPKDLYVLIDRIAGSVLAQEFRAHLELLFIRLPIGLRWAIEELFAQPGRFQTGADLALQAGLRERTLARLIDRAGLGTARKLIVATKLLHGYAYLRSGVRVKDASTRLGYTDTRCFEDNVRSVFGCSPTRLSLTVDASEVVRQVLDWFHKPSRYVLSRSSARAKFKSSARDNKR